MKSTKQTLATLGLAAALVFVGACSTDIATQSEPNSKLSLLSNGPDLPEECTPCWDAFQECFAGGSDLQVCADAIVECTNACQAPPPPPECLHCAAGFEACALAAADNGATGEDCAAGFEGCLSACQSDCSVSPQGCQPGDPTDPGQPGDPTEPPHPLDPQQCDIAVDDCFNDLWNQNSDPAEDVAQICDQLLQDCYADCPDPGGPGDTGTTGQPEVDCSDAVDICLSGNLDQGDAFNDNFSCEDILNFCGI
jgi:hypothetical protein